MKDKLNQWLAFLDRERGDLLEMAKKENELINKADEEYNVLTGDAELKRLAEIRLMSELEEKSALSVAKKDGLEERKRTTEEKNGMEQRKKRAEWKNGRKERSKKAEK